MTLRWFILCMLPAAAPAQSTQASQAARSAQVARSSQAAQVDPFIGTTVSAVDTRWGNEGGCYPGAVAPNGYAQLTPETRPDGGYDYHDSLIYRFSCAGHHSGFPGGSAGRFFVMPLRAEPAPHGRPFAHRDERATPGYYRVRLTDDGTLIETVATPHAGVFRFTFREGVTPRILVEGIDDGAFRFSAAVATHDGNVFTFRPTRTLLLTVGVSSVDSAGARRNMDAECDAPFDTLVARTRAKWSERLSVVKTGEDNPIFYTALYHSLLLPWIISDVDGRYRGADGKVHQAEGHIEYGVFSPWDTYRTLNPLRAWLYPELESAIARSMMDVYRQTGYLPVGPMTGNHAVAILVDDYRKGVPGIDSTELSGALKFRFRRDRAIYERQGYVPSTIPESVTLTLDYAYDDACIAMFRGEADPVSRPADSAASLGDMAAPCTLFDPATLLLLPRNGDNLNRHPGNAGYKEGDAWGYAYNVPQDPDGLIDLMGGRAPFAARLDSVLSDGRVLFDNETVLQLPYFFDYAGRSDLTQRHVRDILEHRYQAIPGGLPGNDDLGAMSSWYVWSALGLYPFCPGRPSYAIGAPLFKDVRVRGWHIRSNASPRNRYIQSIRINGKPYREATISHALLATGGTIDIVMGPVPGPALQHENPEQPRFATTAIAVARPVMAGAPVRIHFTVHKTSAAYNKTAAAYNKTSAAGTFHVRLWANGKVIATRNVLMQAGDTVKTDSATATLYRPGPTTLRLDSADTEIHLDVQTPRGPEPNATVLALDAPLVSPRDTKMNVHLIIKNPGWRTGTFRQTLYIDDQQKATTTATLGPGEEAMQTVNIAINTPGAHQLKAGAKTATIKVYDKKEDATILDFNGRCEDTTLNLPTTRLGASLTMMCWVCPTERQSADIFTLGDYDVLQEGGGSLTFFAGGWGRGDCTVDVPDDWIGHWHHIAGVCSPDGLRLYIDGKQKKYVPLGKTSLDYKDGIWMIGGNFEFPGERRFHGQVANPAIFLTALGGDAIRARASKTP